MRGLKLGRSFLRGLALANGDTSAEGILRVKNKFLAELFSQTKSLIGTRMDPELYLALEKMLGAKRFLELTISSAASSVMSVSKVPSTEVPDYRANCKETSIGSA